MSEIAPEAIIEILRSGRYRQGRGQLRTPQGGYCCLGVMAREAGFTDDEIDDHEGPPEMVVGDHDPDDSEVVQAAIDRWNVRFPWLALRRNAYGYVSYVPNSEALAVALMEANDDRFRGDTYAGPITELEAFIGGNDD